MQLRSDLAAARQEQAQAASATSVTVAATQKTAQETATKVAALETKPQADGFRAGATTIKMGGFLKMVASGSHFSDGEVATNSLGRDFYLPQAIPTGGAPASHVQDFSAKQTRLWFNLATDVAGHSVKAYLETDFQTAAGAQGSQRTTNGYNLALRRAYLQLDRWTFGQDWSTFQYTGALPESTDFVGATEGTVFVRQPLIRYSAPLSKQATLHVSLENPEAGTATLGSPTLIENGDDRLPDVATRLAVTGKFGELSLGGLFRQVRAETNGVSAQATGWGVSAAGKIAINAKKGADLRFMATYGQNIGRYVGLNFAPDAVYVAAGNSLQDVNVFAGLVAVRLPLTPQMRLNVMGSLQTVDYANSLAAASLAGFNKQAWSGAVNLFYSPVKNIDLGLEYRHGEHELVSGADGTLDRIEFAAKYNF